MAEESLIKILKSRNDQRKNDPERRLNERRKNWEEIKQLSRDTDIWRFEGRRKYGHDQRKKADKRVIKDRRRSERRKQGRRGDPLSRPPRDIRYLPDQVAEARAVSGGIKRDRLSLASPEKLAVPTLKYEPPVPASVQQDPQETEPSAFENTFPGLTRVLGSAGQAAKRRWHSLFPRRKS